MSRTDPNDLGVNVDPDRSLEQMVDYVLDARRAGVEGSEVLRELTTTFGLSFDDARLALDRVEGGLTRAETTHPGNAPDPKDDPVAWNAYRRARGAPPAAPPPPPSSSWLALCACVARDGVSALSLTPVVGELSEQHVEAMSLFRAAVEGTSRTRGTNDRGVALRLHELAVALASSGPEPGVLRRVLIQTGTAISTVTESSIERCCPGGYAEDGTPEWFDGLRLEPVALDLARLFAAAGFVEEEGRALYLRGRIVTALLGHHRHHLGQAMLDRAHYHLRLGDLGEAARLAALPVEHMAKLLDQFDDDDDVPIDEDLLALRQLLALLAVVREASGDLDEALSEIERRTRTLLVVADGE